MPEDDDDDDDDDNDKKAMWCPALLSLVRHNQIEELNQRQNITSN